MIYLIVHILFYFIFGYLTLMVGYLLMLSIAGNFFRTRSPMATGEYYRIAILIPTYREDEVIVNTVQSAVEHDYPKQKFDVYVAADHLQKTTIEKLRSTGAQVFDLLFEKGSKARSLNFLLNQIDGAKYDVALILDGDNIMQPGLLQKINAGVRTGKWVLQAHRTAKNMNTPVAVLDALSEEVNNHLFRKGASQIGLSSSLIGSGMAFPFNVLKQVYNKPEILDNPACDREADFEMLVNGLKIYYLPDAIVFDEKVASNRVYENQRRRWLESQLMHINLFFSDWKRVRRKNSDFWHKLFITLLPPRLMVLGIFCIIMVLAFAQRFWNINITGIAAGWWVILFVAYLLSILIAVPRRFYSTKTLRAFLHLPSMLFTFLRALLTVRSKRTEFVHTPKTYTDSSATTNGQE
jgi:cellulose synthase/poly-beta-1,6-N-acetylglucosamine synthase-like glycosyltransferase